jgi:hypothetical protein
MSEKREPTCPLCAGSMEREKSVFVGPNVQHFTLAWVCTHCSAAFPIAVGKGGLVRKAQPLYDRGNRIR